MLLARWIRDHRPAVLLIALVTVSLASLVSGARGSVLYELSRETIVVASYPFVRILRGLEDGLSYATGALVAHHELRGENQSLHRRLGVMLQHSAQRQELIAENQRLRHMLDFERANTRFTLLPAKVLQRSDGILTIDLGSIHGMRESMCVISADGVIGMLTQVDLLTAHVVTLDNPNSKVDAMIGRNRVRGIVSGSSSSLTRLCRMEYIDLKDDVREGDHVVTSPDSVFPSGYPIGVVRSVESDPGSLLQAAEIMPAADPFNVDEIFILLDADPEWRDMAGRPPEPQLERTVEVLDTRTVQERYAP